MSILSDQKQLEDVQLAVVTIHDACPAFSSKIFKFTEEVGRLDIKYSIALIPFFNEKQDLPSFPEFVDKSNHANDANLLYMVFIMRIEMASLMIFIQ
jgi:hypothetical protein